jgi:membrane protease YdiL (CAAX protease family)
VTASPTSDVHSEQSAVTPDPPHALELWSALGLTALWLVMISRFGEGDVYSVMGPFACAVCALCFALRRRDLPRAFRTNTRGVLSGLALGVLMTVATYPAFQLAVKVMPSLDAQVQSLYHGARSTTLPKALAWTSAVILAEELLFRGILPSALSHLTSKRNAYTLAVLVYMLAQLGSGSFIVALLALACGTIWTILRVRTQSLLPALIAHAIWTPTTILLYPVT